MQGGEPREIEGQAGAEAKRPLFGASADELRAWVVGCGHKAYRVKQVLQWAFHRRARSFGDMTDVPLDLRKKLDAEWTLFATELAFRGVADDGAEKLLLRCRDGRNIECVLMGDAESTRRTVCISTQVGCGMGCVFCASGLKGVERNLTSAEIFDQVLQAQSLLPPGESVTHIVVMGMGESLANLDNLLVALDRVCSPADGLGMSQRRVTVSTVGLPEKIRKLAAQDRQYHLAVSLHAPTEALRDELVPVNEKIGLAAVLEAADDYFRITGRQVTYEYVMLGGVNDRREHARALGKLLKGRKSHVNLIPYNPVAGLPFRRPEPEDVRRFVSDVESYGVSVTIRRTRGRSIDAACGQLRRRFEDQDQARGEPEPVAIGGPS
ncbi:23S rRNA (adenine(2503)-C(2))-methyltransferase RlmN [Planctomyces sp. SH-PL62]|uniref:23S rRNA (adenine(2503)-C(2))-methyltransferase RlmN n=1 Tax=Planctomyces sp. SH-PL62 TaxID=1636152 RepID=UPI00078CB458|nr:23S rRNA (adenine(2503)-C(2))-methyltransferase RlmN [Planctomyces sp. SH-PL62]AMV37921.1 putative dual-specificity RNA methyltransferase RlmN [Planctomyces sp. SH-PL62]